MKAFYSILALHNEFRTTTAFHLFSDHIFFHNRSIHEMKYFEICLGEYRIAVLINS